MRFSLPRPSDYHTHFRQGEMLKTVAPYTARRCGRALLMPNTTPPIASARAVVRYYGEVIPHMDSCEPVMTLKLMPYTTPVIIKEAFGVGAKAAKLYPEGVTNNSEDGIPAPWLQTAERADTGICVGNLLNPHLSKNLQDSLGAMEKLGMVLCLHGEMPGRDTITPGAHQPDKIDSFLPWVRWVLNNYPKLRVVLEHITTKREVNFIRWCSINFNIAATITAHHLVIRLEDIIGGKLRPHLFCKPIAKFEEDRLALLGAVMSGEGSFFLGTDNAPHPITVKECEECCAGVWFPNWLEYLVGVFEEAGKLDVLPAFTSIFGDTFYKLPTVGGELTLIKEPWKVPHEENGLKPFLGGKTLSWQLV